MALFHEMTVIVKFYRKLYLKLKDMLVLHLSKRVQVADVLL
jgi:hypothetical protein